MTLVRGIKGFDWRMALRSVRVTDAAGFYRSLAMVASISTHQEIDMGLKGSKTEQNLKDAFAGESQANLRYLHFANKADIGARTT